MRNASPLFNLQPGRKLGPQYEVVQLLGAGTEGEVYQILETDTGIYRAAKLYFRHKDPRSKAVVWYARKLHTLRNCSIVLQYHHTQVIQIARQKVLCLVSDLFDGIQLWKWVQMQRGQRLPGYVALHVLYQLVLGLERVHAQSEYHSDVHTENVMIRPHGVGFELKLVDFYNWGRPSKAKQQQDIVDTIRVFYDILGGKEHYSKLSPELKSICAGLKESIILTRFPTMYALRVYLESFSWERVPA